MHRAQSPATETSGLVLTRRDLFTLLGSAAVLVACGGKSHTTSPITVSSGTPVSSGAAPSGGASSSTATASTPPPANGGSNTTSGSVVKIGGPHATGNDAMSVADAQREAQVANGHWQGGWHDATGASGDSDVVIAIDGASRTAKATVSFGGKLLGSAVPTVTYDIDLLSFMMTADSYNVSSPQFGEITISPGRRHECFGQRTLDPRPAHHRSHRRQRHQGWQAGRRQLHRVLHRRPQRQRHSGLDDDGRACNSQPPSAVQVRRQRLTSQAAAMRPSCSTQSRSPQSSASHSTRR